MISKSAVTARHGRHQISQSHSHRPPVPSYLPDFLDACIKDLSGSELKAALFVFRVVERNGGAALRISTRELAAATGISERTVTTVRTQLAKRGIIDLQQNDLYSVPGWLSLPEERPDSHQGDGSATPIGTNDLAARTDSREIEEFSFVSLPHAGASAQIPGPGSQPSVCLGSTAKGSGALPSSGPPSGRLEESPPLDNRALGIDSATTADDVTAGAQATVSAGSTEEIADVGPSASSILAATISEHLRAVTYAIRAAAGLEIAGLGTPAVPGSADISAAVAEVRSESTSEGTPEEIAGLATPAMPTGSANISDSVAEGAPGCTSAGVPEEISAPESRELPTGPVNIAEPALLPKGPTGALKIQPAPPYTPSPETIFGPPVKAHRKRQVQDHRACYSAIGGTGTGQAGIRAGGDHGCSIEEELRQRYRGFLATRPARMNPSRWNIT